MITNFIHAGHGGESFSVIWRSHHPKGQYRDISGCLFWISISARILSLEGVREIALVLTTNLVSSY
ncbi:MAG: hypothetical protein V7L22_16580 [Nostoc sp.]|uniref:hypothetical protein n=1 Tax=Nostoc sp. TaxID=1180 RepID=UPI002FF6A5F3